MTQNKSVECPICNSGKTTDMLKLDCGNLDNSTLYPSLKIVACEKCGHIYNKLTRGEVAGLMKYYEKEYAQINLGSTDKIGDRPGSNNPNTIKRYARLYGLMSRYIGKNFRVLDIGCATGGFLDYLSGRGLRKLHGIDIIAKYISYAKKKDAYDIRFGGAESIPFNDGSMDLLVIDQVLEHIIKPRVAFKEAKRVLTNGGMFCISIPDASRYNKTFFFDFFWFLMKEHIQHFDLEHLKLLAASEGFALVAHLKYDSPMMSEKMILPVLSAVFRRTGKKSRLTINRNRFKLKKRLGLYIADNFKKLNKKRKIISKLAISKKPVYAWGIGREFLYLYESAGLKKCSIAGLIDANPYKQKTYSVGGRKIADQFILKKATPDSALIISAVAHTEQIKKKLGKIGYRGRIIEV